MLPARKYARYTPPPALASTAPADAPIDHAHLNRYTMGDAALEREILGLFIANLPNTIRDLGLADNEADWHRAAHTIKGSARAVGAWRLARSAEVAEGLVPSEDRSASEAAIGDIAEAAAETNAYIAKLMASA